MLSIPDPHSPNIVREPFDTMFDHMNFKMPATAVAAFHKTPALPLWAKVHTNIETADETISLLENNPTWQRQLREYFGMVKLIDDHVGNLLSVLKNNDIDKDTIVVFTRYDVIVRGVFTDVS